MIDYKKKFLELQAEVFKSCCKWYDNCKEYEKMIAKEAKENDKISASTRTMYMMAGCAFDALYDIVVKRNLLDAFNGYKGLKKAYSKSEQKND